MNIYTSNKNNIFLFTFSLLVVLVFSFSNPARAQTQSTSSQAEQIQNLLAMIEQLQTQLARLKNGSGSNEQCTELSRSMFLGSTDSDSSGQVSKLQRFLNDTGHYSYGEITGYFGPATQQAVQAWQASKGIVSSGTPETTGYGVVGPTTRVAMARGCNVSISTVNSPIIKKDAYDKTPAKVSNGNDEEMKIQIDQLLNEITASHNENPFKTNIKLMLDKNIVDINDSVSFSYSINGNANDCEVIGEYRNGTLSFNKTNSRIQVTDTNGNGSFYASYIYPYDMLENITVKCKDDETGNIVSESGEIQFSDTSLADYEILINSDFTEKIENIPEAEAHARCRKEVSTESNNRLKIECSWNGEVFRNNYINTGKA